MRASVEVMCGSVHVWLWVGGGWTYEDFSHEDVSLARLWGQTVTPCSCCVCVCVDVGVLLLYINYVVKTWLTWHSKLKFLCELPQAPSCHDVNQYGQSFPALPFPLPVSWPLSAQPLSTRLLGMPIKSETYWQSGIKWQHPVKASKHQIAVHYVWVCMCTCTILTKSLWNFMDKIGEFMFRVRLTCSCVMKDSKTNVWMCVCVCIPQCAKKKKYLIYPIYFFFIIFVCPFFFYNNDIAITRNEKHLSKQERSLWLEVYMSSLCLYRVPSNVLFQSRKAVWGVQKTNRLHHSTW